MNLKRIDTMHKNKAYLKMVNETAEKYGLEKKLVDAVYRAYWRSIKNYIESLPLKDDLTEEEFDKLRPNINLPQLGKLFVSKERYDTKKKNYKRKLKQV